MGSWKNNGVQHFRYHVGQDKDVVVENDENRKKAGKMFTMKGIYYKNNSSPDVKKIASFLEGMDCGPSMVQNLLSFENCKTPRRFSFFIEYSHLVYLQYIFNGVEHPVDPSPHGNCKKVRSKDYKAKHPIKHVNQLIAMFTKPRVES